MTGQDCESLLFRDLWELDWMEKDRRRQRGQVRTGQDMIRQDITEGDRTRQDRTGQDREVCTVEGEVRTST